MNITYNQNGSIAINEIVEGYATRRTYYQYELREAVEAFATEFGIDLTEDLSPCQTCGVGVPTDTWLEEMEFCVECQHSYFTHEEDN